MGSHFKGSKAMDGVQHETKRTRIRKKMKQKKEIKGKEER